MRDDPDFATFWAVFPRKDRKLEARFEWRSAVRRFDAERVILTAARYRAEIRGRPHAEIMTAGEWLPGLLEPEQPPEPERPPGIRSLDLEKLGAALLTACMTSWQLGHSSVHSTVRDYIAPRGPYDAEHELTYKALLGINPQAMISEEDALAWLHALSLAPVRDVDRWKKNPMHGAGL